MAKSTTSTTKKTTQKPKKTKKQSIMLQTGADLTAAVLIVSLLINAFFLCVWVTLKSTSEYDEALAQFFLGR